MGPRRSSVPLSCAARPANWAGLELEGCNLKMQRYGLALVMWKRTKRPSVEDYVDVQALKHM